jgi:subtilisin family serine protease
MRSALLAVVLAAFAILTPSAVAPSFAAAPAAPSRAIYLVQVAGEPLASYTGGVAGIARTKPTEGAKLDKGSWNYSAYREHLRQERRSVLAAAHVDAGRTVAEYSAVFNGFAASLTAAEAARVSTTALVVHIWKNEIRHVDTALAATPTAPSPEPGPGTTPTFLGLAGAGGAWDTQFGDATHAGEGMIVGVIDTGFWPESPSFAPLPEPRPDAAIIQKKWYADGVDKCDEGATHPIACNNKVIGARYYDASGLGDWSSEYTSPRDYDGHGSHTASTAAGDYNVPATINGEKVGNVSGMAPAARIAVYKALWEQEDGDGSGGTADLVHAIDDAVTDGVDVINYSISGSSKYVVDPVGVAFFNAAAAGVFIATSAGNSGPEESTVAHDTPWTTTVAASSHDRGSAKSVTLGNGKTFTGVGHGAALPATPLVDSVGSGVAGADPSKVELCYPGTLDPVKVKGKIVLCKRGVNPRTDKSLAVQQAGGVGMVLYNATLSSLNADYHVVPTVHVGQTEGAAIRAYLASAPSPTASMSEVSTATPRAPEVAAFSSAGPAIVGDGNLVKPDVTAPGVDIVAAVSPSGHHGNLFDGESGTSMSSPHVAGVAALLRSAHPTWTPSEVKSALMTTAGQTDNSDRPIQRNGTSATPFDMGSGHIQPSDAFDPGLVYDSGPEDWIKYGCGINQIQLISDWCDTIGSLDPSDLNYPSIAVGELPGTKTITRTVKNVSSKASVYVASVKAPAGFKVKVTPATISVAAGASVTFTVSLVRSSATYGKWAFGALTWTDLRGHAVRSPIAVKPVALQAAGEVGGSGATGSGTVTVHGGYTGTVTAQAYGLVKSTITSQKLTGSDHAFDPTAPAVSATAYKTTVVVPAGTAAARVATYASDHAPSSDIDLYVYKAGTSTSVGESAGGTADESVDLSDPGSYDVYVVQFAAPAAQDVKVHSFVVGHAAAGNVSISPAAQPIKPDQDVTFLVSWTDLDPDGRYLGVLEFGDGSAVRATTLLSIGRL